MSLDKQPASYNTQLCCNSRGLLLAGDASLVAAGRASEVVIVSRSSFPSAPTLSLSTERLRALGRIRNLSGDGDEKSMLAALDMQTPLHPGCHQAWLAMMTSGADEAHGNRDPNPRPEMPRLRYYLGGAHRGAADSWLSGPRL